MRPISPAAVAPVAVPAPRGKVRNVALDHARTFLTLVVLLHHAVIPYTYFGHTDPKYWAGFDGVVLATDSFFMAMFFLLSGLFVWPDIGHKAPMIFLRDRLLRLGLPFVICAFTVIPIAYYALHLEQHGEAGFAKFWWNMITVGPWPSGPIWFVWVLMAFDFVASLLHRFWPNLLDPINRMSLKGFDRPSKFWLLLVVVSAVAYLPPLIHYGTNRWFEYGPFAIQASRILLYASYFFIGAGIGAANFPRGVFSIDGQLSENRWFWAAVTLIPYCGMWMMIYIKREILGNPGVLPDWYHAIYGTFLVLFSASILFAILAYFLHEKTPLPNILDRMRPAAYGMFLVHYPIMLWLQYWMFDLNWPAIVKATVAFVVTVLASWALTVALRKIPGATHIL